MLLTLRQGFNLQVRGRPIQEVTLPKRIDSGIVQIGTEGLVPEYEEREAAVYAQYTPMQWSALDWAERALTVAQYRCHFVIEALLHEAADRAADRKRDKR